jgi:hypothetical protein
MPDKIVASVLLPCISKVINGSKFAGTYKINAVSEKKIVRSTD